MAVDAGSLLRAGGRDGDRLPAGREAAGVHADRAVGPEMRRATMAALAAILAATAVVAFSLAVKV